MIPDHYSRDIAQRCLSLIDALQEKVRENRDHRDRFGGPLSTTFLLAMAAPMIILPIERMYKPSTSRSQFASDESELDPNLGAKIVDVIGGQRTFGGCPFFKAGHWSYAIRREKFNVAEAWPHQLIDDLGTEEAKTRAAATQASRILIDLRNALAHGGIAYLDKDGRQTEGEAAMFAFASASTKWNQERERHEVVKIKALRIGENEFRLFLKEWADWLNDEPVRDVLNTRDPLEY